MMPNFIYGSSNSVAKIWPNAGVNNVGQFVQTVRKPTKIFKIAISSDILIFIFANDKYGQNGMDFLHSFISFSSSYEKSNYYNISYWKFWIHEYNSQLKNLCFHYISLKPMYLPVHMVKFILDVSFKSLLNKNRMFNST